ncbi:MAG: molecular chaperone DnaJ [Planctomycetota bacterium]|jgi:molecular chaperone DnaJ
MSQKRDYYDVFGVQRNASADEIKKAYRKLAMKHHPDRNPDDAGAEEKFKEAAEAYDILGDQEKRAQYDQFGHAAFSQGGMGGGGAGFSNMEDIFSAFGDIFSGGGGGGGGGVFGDLFGGGGGRRRSGPARGRDLKIVLDMTLEEIDQGVERTITLKQHDHCGECDGSGAEPGTSKTTCSTCAGRGQVQRNQGFFTMAAPCPTCRGAGETLESPCTSCRGSGKKVVKNDVTINVPAGVEEGMRVRVEGSGDAGEPGAPRGDLYCIIREKEHRMFQRSGPDVMTEIPFTFTQLTLGDKVEIPTLRGSVEMTIPAGTQSGKIFRLRGQGLPHVQSKSKGDQMIRVFVEVPENISKEQRELLEEFDRLESEKPDSKSFFDRIASYFSA